MHVYIPCDVSAADQLWCCVAGQRLHLGTALQLHGLERRWRQLAPASRHKPEWGATNK